MRFTLLNLLFMATAVVVGRADIIEFDLSPPGTDCGTGLHPLNQVIPGPSNGSGNEFGSGIFFDTSTRLLSFNLAYGSAFGFTDLTGPAFSWLLHGPSPLGETAPALFNLEAFHTFALDHAQGGQIIGAVALDTTQEADLIAGLGYINIYTTENLGGELRGQLVLVPEPGSLLLLGMAASTLIWSCTRKRRKSPR